MVHFHLHSLCSRENKTNGSSYGSLPGRAWADPHHRMRIGSQLTRPAYMGDLYDVASGNVGYGADTVDRAASNGAIAWTVANGGGYYSTVDANPPRNGASFIGVGGNINPNAYLVGANGAAWPELPASQLGVFATAPDGRTTGYFNIQQPLNGTSAYRRGYNGVNGYMDDRNN